MRYLCLLLLNLILFQSIVFAQPTDSKDLDVTKNENFQHNLWDDTKEAFDYMVRGSYLQFKEPSALITLGVATAFLIPYSTTDKHDSRNLSRQKDHSFEGWASDAGLLVNVPILPLATYYLGRYNQDEKMIKFSQEVTAATTLALAESMFISLVPIHPRPSPDDLSVWETAFRYESSFPSGHTLGWNVLTFKTLQYYGPWPALVPAGLAYLSSVERVKTDKHYLSDVIGSTALALMASEGVRVAADHKNNHPVYKWIFEHEFKVGFMYLDQKSVGTISWNY